MWILVDQDFSTDTTRPFTVETSFFPDESLIKNVLLEGIKGKGRKGNLTYH